MLGWFDGSRYAMDACGTQWLIGYRRFLRIKEDH